MTPKAGGWSSVYDIAYPNIQTIVRDQEINKNE
jgi:hypothetical protein